jgi:hypothetical protein
MVLEGQIPAETNTLIQPQSLVFSINVGDDDIKTSDNQMLLRRKVRSLESLSMWSSSM